MLPHSSDTDIKWDVGSMIRPFGTNEEALYQAQISFSPAMTRYDMICNFNEEIERAANIMPNGGEQAAFLWAQTVCMTLQRYMSWFWIALVSALLTTDLCFLVERLFCIQVIGTKIKNPVDCITLLSQEKSLSISKVWFELIEPDVSWDGRKNLLLPSAHPNCTLKRDRIHQGWWVLLLQTREREFSSKTSTKIICTCEDRAS